MSLNPNSGSWFTQAAHRWPDAGEAAGYAMACLDYVLVKSTEAQKAFKSLVDNFNKPGLQRLGAAWRSQFTDTQWKENTQEAIQGFSDDPNGTFVELNEFYSDEAKLTDDNEEQPAMVRTAMEILRDNEDYIKWCKQVSDFITSAFNRQSNIDAGKIKVQLSTDPPWLYLVIMLRCMFESKGISMSMASTMFKEVEEKGQRINYEDVLTQQPMSRRHRKITKIGKAKDLKLHNDQMFIEAAELWYKCRIVYPSVYAYCKAIDIDSKNVYKKVRLCDDALGYVR
jgi:hypothetical protein